MARKKKTVSEELNLLMKRQTAGEDKSIESELSLVEKLEKELKERKKEAKQKMKEEEDKKILAFGRSLMKKHGVNNPDQLSELMREYPRGNEGEIMLSQKQRAALIPLLDYGKELADQPNKFVDFNAIKRDLAQLYETFSKE